MSPYLSLSGSRLLICRFLSRIHLPEPFHKLMADDDSPIKDFYPLEFQIDMNGKKMLWQGVALLPFVDAQRLKEQMRIVSTDLSDDEVSRNTLGTDTIFVGKDHQLYDYIEGLYTKRKVTEVSLLSLVLPLEIFNLFT
jgi:5'-3' exoribonuclease 2